jgi:hypothetical protein
MAYETLPTTIAASGTQAPTRALPGKAVIVSGIALIAVGCIAAFTLGDSHIAVTSNLASSGYTGLVTDGSAVYTSYATGAEPSSCSGGIGTKVPDSCCASGNAGSAGDFTKYTCTAYVAAPGLDVRNYFGCDDGEVTFAEACVPSGLVLEKTYPFPAADASKYAENGTPKTCGCGANGAFPSIYKGAGCYVAVPSSTTAFYVKFSGTCAAPATTTEMTASTTTTTFDMTNIVGNGKLGMGAIETTTADTSDYAPWGLALSGNGLLAEGAASGLLRVLHENDILSQLTTISSNSGGSWFNSQFAYSKAYFEGVTGTDGSGDSIATWYESYMGSMTLAASSPFTWEGMITGMLGSGAGISTSVEATDSARVGNTDADLLFMTTLMGGSLLSDNTTVSQMYIDGEKSSFSVPAFWTVSKSGNFWSVPDANPTDPTDLSALSWSSAASVTPDDATTILQDPSVIKIATMSSAANGITGNPQLIAKTLELSDDDAALYTSNMGVTPGETSPGNGVCTVAGDTCSYPAAMTMDGCYSDNLAFAVNVGYLQRKYPGKKLRLLGMTSDLCDRTTDPSCKTAVEESSFRSFFADSPYPTTEGWLPLVVPGPNRTIFAESVTDMLATGQQTGYGGQTFVTGTFTTVQNDHFGVAAGTEVTLLVVNANGPVYLSPGNSAEVMGLADVATNTYNSWKSLLSTFTMNSKLDGTTAYLYYQQVGASSS